MLALAAAPASARDVVSVVVEFAAPQGCSDRETFALGLRSRSDRIQIAESNGRGWIVNVRLTPKDRGVRGELRLTDERGESELRAVDGVDCAEVVEALSLTAALAIEQTVERAATGSASTPTTPGTTSNATGRAGAAATDPAVASKPPSIATPPAKIEDTPTASTPSTGSAAGNATHVGVTAFATQRVWPQTSFGLSLLLSQQFALTEGWASELSIGAFYSPSDTLQPKSEIRVSYVGVSFQGCPVVWAATATITLTPCAVFELARLTVTDRVVDVSQPSKRLTGFVGGLGRGRVRLARHVDLALEVELLAPIASRRYLTNSPGTEVGHTEPIAWQAGIGWLFGW